MTQLIPERQLPISGHAKPTVLLLSTKEATRIVEALACNMDKDYQVIPWQCIFGASQLTINVLCDAIGKVDFGIVVLSPDDEIKTRGSTYNAPRDNLLLELGMLISKLGIERSFVLCDENIPTKTPSDLAGLTVVNYRVSPDWLPEASLFGTATRLKRAMERLGPRR